MNRYAPSTPRAALGFAAMALAAMTVAMLVVVPAQVDRHGERMPTAVASEAGAPPTEVIVRPARIDVVGDRDEKTAFEPAPQIRPKPKHAG